MMEFYPRDSGLDQSVERIEKLKRSLNKREWHQGNKNGMEEWSVPLFSSLSPDEFHSISFDNLVDQWSSLGIQEPALSLKRLQVQVHEGRICVHEIRQTLDATVRDHPMGNLILAAYKTELLYLWDRWHNTVQELDKSREQLTISENRIEALVTDSDDRTNKITEDHQKEIEKLEAETKEKYERIRKTLRGEIEYLECSIAQQRESFDQTFKKGQETELHLKRKCTEYTAEIQDLREQIQELKCELDTSENKKQKVLIEHRKFIDGGPDYDLDASLIVDEYEKCIRGLQDKIDEQNTTINSLKDQVNESLTRQISERNEPDGEESNSFSDDNYEHVLQQHHLTSTPSNNYSMAEEIRCNGMTPRRLGKLLSDQDDGETQTERMQQNDSHVQCQIKTEVENDQEKEIDDLKGQLKIAMEEHEQASYVVNENEELKEQMSSILYEKDEQAMRAEELTEKIAYLQSKLAKSTTQADTEAAESFQLRNASDTLKIENEQLVAAIREKTICIDRLQIMTDKIQKENGDIRDEIVGAQDARKMAEQQINDFVVSLAQIKEEALSLKLKVQNLQGKVDHKNELLEIYRKKLSKTNSSLVRSKKENEEEQSLLREQIQTLEQEIDTRHNEIVKISGGNEKKIEEMVEKVEKLSQRHQCEINRHLDLAESLQAQLKQLHKVENLQKSEIISKEMRIGEMEKLCQKLSNQLLISETEKDRLSSEVARLFLDFNANCEKTSSTISDNSEGLLKKLEAQMMQLSDDKSRIEKELIEKAEENEKLQQELWKNNGVQKKYSKGKIDLTELAKEVDLLQVEIGVSKKLLKQKEATIKELKYLLNKDAHLKTEIETLKHTDANLRQEVVNYQKSYTQANCELNESVVKFNKLKISYEQLTSKFNKDKEFYRSKIKELDGQIREMRVTEQKQKRVFLAQRKTMVENNEKLKTKNNNLDNEVRELNLGRAEFQQKLTLSDDKIQSLQTLNKELSDGLNNAMKDEEGLRTEVITEETTEIHTTTLSPKRSPTSKFIKVSFEESDVESDEENQLYSSVSATSASQLKSISRDSGFDERELLSRLEKLETENSLLKKQEEGLSHSIDLPLKGTIAYSRDKHCLKYFADGKIACVNGRSETVNSNYVDVSQTQMERLNSENEVLTKKLRQTREQLSENTIRDSGMFISTMKYCPL